MSEELLLKIIFCGFICGGVAWRAYCQEDRETSLEKPEENRAKYINHIPVLAFPMFILTLLGFNAAFYGWKYSIKSVLVMCFEVLIQISLLYVVLLLVMPFLRKYFSSRTCAALWMLPTFLYLIRQVTLTTEEPLVVLSASNQVIKIAAVIWVAGFVIVLGYYVVSHLTFRHRILKDAVVIADKMILKVWEDEKEYANIHNQFGLVISKEAKTPLSIGMLRGTTKVVLPQRTYTEEELHLIFRHELIHIGREDSCTKFFLLFCTALGWFNPLMWAAMRMSADDLELSCDETVLLDAEEDTRKKYAELILNTTGERRGFTTCLSASATALKYRLSNVMKIRKRWNGGMFVGLVLFLFLMTSGYVALAFEKGSGEEYIFNVESAEAYELESIHLYDGIEYKYPKCTDKNAFIDYLSNLEMLRISEYYVLSNDGKRINCYLVGNEKAIGVTITEHIVRLNYLGEEKLADEMYYLKSEVDWNYLESLLE